MRGITKQFPGVLANDRVDFNLETGEVHTLLGENGAGKSTLMKILYGMYRPDDGEVLLRGERVTIDSPSAAIEGGIGMIHQHFMLVPTLTVTENVALGLQSRRRPLTDLPTVADRIRELSDTYGLRVDPDTPIWQLAVGERQRVEILKALYREATVLVMDEPTNDLDIETLELLEELLLEFRGTLLLVSHDRQFMDQVVTSTLVLEGGGVIREYVGGYTDWERQRPKPVPAEPEIPRERPRHSPEREKSRKKPGYREQQELSALPQRIETLEERQAELTNLVSGGDFYRQDQETVATTLRELDLVSGELEECYRRWEELES